MKVSELSRMNGMFLNGELTHASFTSRSFLDLAGRKCTSGPRVEMCELTEHVAGHVEMCELTEHAAGHLSISTSPVLWPLKVRLQLRHIEKENLSS